MWECISEMLGVIYVYIVLLVGPWAMLFIIGTLCIGILMIIRSLFNRS